MGGVTPIGVKMEVTAHAQTNYFTSAGHSCRPWCMHNATKNSKFRKLKSLASKVMIKYIYQNKKYLMYDLEY